MLNPITPAASSMTKSWLVRLIEPPFRKKLHATCLFAINKDSGHLGGVMSAGSWATEAKSDFAYLVKMGNSLRHFRKGSVDGCTA
jgi:hypothetical protein